MRRWIETPIEFWEACQREYGSVVQLELGSLGPVVLLAEPEHVRQVFALPTSRFECRHYNEHYRYVMGDHSVLLQDGDTHFRQRRMLNPAFRPDQLFPAAPVIRDIVRGVVSRWPVGEPFNPRPDLHEISFEIMVHLVVGTLDSDTSRALISGYRQAVLRQVGSWGPWRNFARLQTAIREVIAEEIRQRRADPSAPGLLTRLAQARDEHGEPLSNVECEDHVFSMMVAGVDTAAIALAWALHWIGRDAAVRDRLVAELADARAAGVDDFRELPYLHAVYSETLRMYPIVPTPSGRRLMEETQVGEHTFPVGTTLVPCTYLVHRQPALYPDGDQFIPERFLDRRFARYEYLPYGGGARICVGEALAHIEFKVVLATILELWSVDAGQGPALRPVRHGTLLAPSDDLRVRVTPADARGENGAADLVA